MYILNNAAAPQSVLALGTLFRGKILVKCHQERLVQEKCGEVTEHPSMTTAVFL